MGTRFPNWVADDAAGNRQNTAVLLVGTAKEYNLTVRHHISSTRGGFYITDDLADLLEDSEDGEDTKDEDVEQEVEGQGSETTKTETKSAKKTSGNRAAKNASQEGE
jgi:hypothetical protein